MLDEDEAGRTGRMKILERLALIKRFIQNLPLRAGGPAARIALRGTTGGTSHTMSQLDLFSWRPPRRKKQAKSKSAHEWKIVSLRETEPDALPMCDVPEKAVEYWRAHIATTPHFNPDVECVFAVLILNTKMRIRGHHLISIGSLNETMANPREVFRAAVIAAAYAIVLMHNHPSWRLDALVC